MRDGQRHQPGQRERQRQVEGGVAREAQRGAAAPAFVVAAGRHDVVGLLADAVDARAPVQRVALLAGDQVVAQRGQRDARRERVDAVVQRGRRQVSAAAPSAARARRRRSNISAPGRGSPARARRRSRAARRRRPRATSRTRLGMRAGDAVEALAARPRRPRRRPAPARRRRAPRCARRGSGRRRPGRARRSTAGTRASSAPGRRRPAPAPGWSRSAAPARARAAAPGARDRRRCPSRWGRRRPTGRRAGGAAVEVVGQRLRDVGAQPLRPQLVVVDRRAGVAGADHPLVARQRVGHRHRADRQQRAAPRVRAAGAGAAAGRSVWKWSGGVEQPASAGAAPARGGGRRVVRHFGSSGLPFSSDSGWRSR